MLKLRRSYAYAFAIALAGMTAAVGHRLAEADVVEVEGQPLSANVRRAVEALESLGAPLPANFVANLRAAGEDPSRLQRVLDEQVALVVRINPEERVKVERGEAPARLKQGGYVPILVKVVNESTCRKPLNIRSPQSGLVPGGTAPLSMKRQEQTDLVKDATPLGDKRRFLQVEMFRAPPMTDRLSGLAVEYAIALIYASESGKREATIGFDVGQGTQDLGFRGETPVLFDVEPGVAVKLAIKDHDGKPTTARLVFADRQGRVYPPQPKRLAPDFFFQKQIYRADGATVLLPPGPVVMTYSRGPEYVVRSRELNVPAAGPLTVEIRLERWIDTNALGYYGGDHHIHAAGCAHYTSPTEGVLAEDMFPQVKGEGLNVGCVLTWGPCYDYQRRFFEPGVHKISEPLTLLKYDVEVSGFGSQALGHVCLLNLKDQTFPGSDGTSTKGWPTWTTPLMRWAKEQGAVTGYAHSASGLAIHPGYASKRLIARLDADRDEFVSIEEAGSELFPEPFDAIDSDRDGKVGRLELEASHDRAADRLPNWAIPEMDGVGAMEVCVTTALGLCDFMSAMDTPRIAEWNCWYHLLNCGFPLRVSGETDFPCMSSTRVGQGRVYVKLGKVEKLDFSAWCEGIAKGRSYVSDGYAHAIDFAVNGKGSGETLELNGPGTVRASAKIAFAPGTPLDVAHGVVEPREGRRVSGDTVVMHEPRNDGRSTAPGAPRLVELVVNGVVAASRSIPADGRPHEVEFAVPLSKSSWIALRQFPQLHTNPVVVSIDRMPVRASRKSARWCADVIDQLWKMRARNIAPNERKEAEETFRKASEIYRRIAAEAPPDS